MAENPIRLSASKKHKKKEGLAEDVVSDTASNHKRTFQRRVPKLKEKKRGKVGMFADLDDSTIRNQDVQSQHQRGDRGELEREEESSENKENEGNQIVTRRTELPETGREFVDRSDEK